MAVDINKYVKNRLNGLEWGAVVDSRPAAGFGTGIIERISYEDYIKLLEAVYLGLRVNEVNEANLGYFLSYILEVNPYEAILAMAYLRQQPECAQSTSYHKLVVTGSYSNLRVDKSDKLFLDALTSVLKYVNYIEFSGYEAKDEFLDLLLQLKQKHNLAFMFKCTQLILSHAQVLKYHELFVGNFDFIINKSSCELVNVYHEHSTVTIRGEVNRTIIQAIFNARGNQIKKSKGFFSPKENQIEKIKINGFFNPNFFVTSNTINKIVISHCVFDLASLDNNFLVQFLQNFPNLTELEFSDINFNPDTNEARRKFLKSLDELIKLHNLKCIAINRCKLTDDLTDHIIGLADNLVDNRFNPPKRIMLNIEHNNFNQLASMRKFKTKTNIIYRNELEYEELRKSLHELLDSIPFTLRNFRMEFSRLIGGYIGADLIKACEYLAKLRDLYLPAEDFNELKKEIELYLRLFFKASLAAENDEVFLSLINYLNQLSRNLRSDFNIILINLLAEFISLGMPRLNRLAARGYENVEGVSVEQDFRTLQEAILNCREDKELPEKEYVRLDQLVADWFLAFPFAEVGDLSPQKYQEIIYGPLKNYYYENARKYPTVRAFVITLKHIAVYKLNDNQIISEHFKLCLAHAAGAQFPIKFKMHMQLLDLLIGRPIIYGENNYLDISSLEELIYLQEILAELLRYYLSEGVKGLAARCGLLDLDSTEILQEFFLMLVQAKPTTYLPVNLLKEQGNVNFSLLLKELIDLVFFSLLRKDNSIDPHQFNGFVSKVKEYLAYLSPAERLIIWESLVTKFITTDNIELVKFAFIICRENLGLTREIKENTCAELFRLCEAEMKRNNFAVVEVISSIGSVSVAVNLHKRIEKILLKYSSDKLTGMLVDKDHRLEQWLKQNVKNAKSFSDIVQAIKDYFDNRNPLSLKAALLTPGSLASNLLQMQNEIKIFIENSTRLSPSEFVDDDPRSFAPSEDIDDVERSLVSTPAAIPAVRLPTLQLPPVLPVYPKAPNRPAMALPVIEFIPRAGVDALDIRTQDELESDLARNSL